MGQTVMLEEKISFKESIKFLSHFITKVILYVILILLMIVFFLFSIYFGNVLHNIKNQEDRPPLFNAYIIVSPSMVPNINVWDGIVVKREDVHNLKKGDIITFTSHDMRYNGLTITHRIVGIEKTEDSSYYFRTKGDANNVEDPYLVQENDVYGKVIFRIPMIGYIKNFLSKYFGWIVFLIVPALMVIIYDVLRIVHTIKSKKRKKDDIEII